MKPQSSKAKGRRGQYLVRDCFLEAFSSLAPDDIRSNPMGAPGQDLLLSPAARVVIPYQIEIKNKAKSQMHTWYAQATSHGDHEPLLIVKMDGDKILAAVSLDHFLELIQKVHEHSKKNA